MPIFLYSRKKEALKVKSFKSFLHLFLPETSGENLNDFLSYLIVLRFSICDWSYFHVKTHQTMTLTSVSFNWISTFPTSLQLLLSWSWLCLMDNGLKWMGRLRNEVSYCQLKKKKKKRCTMWEVWFNFIWGKIRTNAPETASQIVLRN